MGEARIGRKPPAAHVPSDWDEAAIQQLRELWSDGYSTSEIGRRMGRPKNSIVGKAHRLGLPSRASPIKRHAGPVTAPTERSLVLREKRGHGFAPRLVATLPAVVEAPPAPPPAPAAPHVPGTGCRFPLWGLQERATQMFCDKPRRTGRDGTPNSSFCPECHRRCYLTPQQHAAQQRLVGREASYAMARARLA